MLELRAMKPLLFTTALLLTCAAPIIVRATASDPTLAASAAAAIVPTAPVELFNGRDLDGWEFFHRDNGDAHKIWRVENGLLKCLGKPTGYARTKQAYKDYQVTVEWRFIQPGNTGVCVHMQLPDKVWPRCIECQGMHDKQGDFWLQGGAETKDHHGADHGGRYIPMREPSNEKPVGEWNTFQVICRGDTVKIIVNSKLMNEATECNVSSGFIGLQSEGAELEIRKVTLAPLPRE